LARNPEGKLPAMFEKAAGPGFEDGDGGGPAKFTKSWLQGELGLVLNSGRAPTRMFIGWPSVTAGLPIRHPSPATVGGRSCRCLEVIEKVDENTWHASKVRPISRLAAKKV